MLSEKLSYLDGLVGALWNNGQSFITSPNATYIPRPIEISKLILRKDCFYGTDDYLVWPQPYNEEYCHLPAIRRKPGPYEELDPNCVMWEPFDAQTQFTWHETGGGGVGRFGMLKEGVAQRAAESISRLMDQTKDPELLEKRSVPPKAREYLTMIRQNLDFTFGRVRGMVCNLEEANRGWIEVQRAWQVLDALWDFLTIHRARISGVLPEVTTDGQEGESRYIGAFTHDERDAQRLFIAGIPVWLIRPVSAFTTQNILAVVIKREPELCMDLPSQPVVLSDGHTGATKKFRAIEAASHKFCLHPDPFEIAEFMAATTNSGRRDALLTHRSAPPPVPRLAPPAAGSSRRYPDKQPSPYPKPERGPKGGKSC